MSFLPEPDPMAIPQPDAGALRRSLQQQLQQQPYVLIRTDHIIPDPDQPRKETDPDELQDLARSIEANGLLQPVVVQPADSCGRYQLIIGERRWRAHQICGRREIPALIRASSDTTVLALQIVENNQREDIPPLAEAQALQQLVELSSGNKKSVARVLGRSASWLSKRLSLLKAPEAVQNFAVEQAVNDVNTLNSLARLYEDAPARAEHLMRAFCQHGAEGGFRNRVEKARQQLQSDEPLPAAPAEPLPHSEKISTQLLYLQQLKLAPLNTLPGIGDLAMSFAETEQRFRHFLLAADLQQSFDQLWLQFIAGQRQ